MEGPRGSQRRDDACFVLQGGADLDGVSLDHVVNEQGPVAYEVAQSARSVATRLGVVVPEEGDQRRDARPQQRVQTVVVERRVSDRKARKLAGRPVGVLARLQQRLEDLVLVQVLVEVAAVAAQVACNQPADARSVGGRPPPLGGLDGSDCAGGTLLPWATRPRYTTR